MKNLFYGVLCILGLTLSVCLIVITSAYYDSIHHPKAKVDVKGIIQYEQPVDSASEAGDLFWKARNSLNRD